MTFPSKETPPETQRLRRGGEGEEWRILRRS